MNVSYQVVEAGVDKARLPLWKLVMLGLVAGFYIGFGALLMLNIGVSCPGLATVSTSAKPHLPILIPE
jgi:formate/nitrite transporter FocA (FNT family)